MQMFVYVFVQNEKKAELGGKSDRARDAVAKLTSAIEQMRQSRDEKVADITRLQQQIEVFLSALYPLYFIKCLCISFMLENLYSF